ncbi:Glycerol uptake facilitator (Major Intrinsic Protein Family) [Loktanella atrilutea]|uniref:Glycerol uptake facilitator (Major Intrinsic Protein Family) n=1 Tax=Loktanella atrilutea TaxID=366533 RepID=A0A1M4UD71_LOKAT|nr:MIP/aquaporin family protein [Loktanella atrilutea]SHE54510.1 Glycerol uptake facilitator (Major Intrinsic Protein Family) [Loktanella atrilutea]
MTQPPLRARLIAETLGTTFLLIGVVGSGIMADRLAQGNDAVALLANAIATGCILHVLITTLGPVSGAHFNPAVTLAFRIKREIGTRDACAYTTVQIIGAVLGVWLAHLMFDLPLLQFSVTARSGPAQWLSEAIATFGLVFVIFAGVRHRPDTVPTLVALYITGAYWFTSSTSFANPAVTLARAMTDTFAGINPANVPMFILAQLCGTGLALLLLPHLWKSAAEQK